MEQNSNSSHAKGMIVAVLSVLWWIASIGGVIYVINATS